MRNYGEAFRSRNVILLCAQYFTGIGVYGFVLWLPSIIRSGGENLGMVEVGWLSSVPYGCDHRDDYRLTGIGQAAKP